jgi:hypothetical protein
MDQSGMWLLIGLVGLLLLAYVVLVFGAIVQVVRRREISSAAKALWVVAIVVFPPFATMAWYLFGHRTADVERSLGLPAPHLR